MLGPVGDRSMIGTCQKSFPKGCMTNGAEKEKVLKGLYSVIIYTYIISNMPEKATKNRDAFFFFFFLKEMQRNRSTTKNGLFGSVKKKKNNIAQAISVHVVILVLLLSCVFLGGRRRYEDYFL